LPGSINAITGGTIYDRRLIGELRRLGWHIDLVELAPDFPQPSAASLADATGRLLHCTDLVMIDGLAFGAMPDIAARLSERVRLVDLLHHPLCLENGLDPATAERLERSEAAALRHADHVIVTSPTTREEVATRFGYPAGRITVALPGIDKPAIAEGGTPMTLVNVGSFIPRKDHPTLIRALARIKDLPWRMIMAGSRDRDPGYTDEVSALIEENGLEDRVELAGELDDGRLAEVLHHSDLMVSASRYEGYGMALAEGLAAGLPVIAVRGGAVEETVPDDAGVFVEPGDDSGLAGALESMIEDKALWRAKREGALRARAALPSWRDTAHTVQTTLEGLING
jgi:glycosyltransferase involved in cell wall biosynthesis